MAKFRRKPVVIEAFEYRNGEQRSEVVEDVIAGRVRYTEEGTMLLMTLTGAMEAVHGDWIIRHASGHLSMCKPDTFVATYKPVE